MPRAERILGSTLRELVGGRWAISLLAYAINAPLTLAAIGSNADASLPGALWWQWVAVAAIGYAAFGIVLWLAHVTVFRDRATKPLPVAAVITLGGLAGVARGLVVGIVPALLDIAPDSLALSLTRVATSAVLGAVLWPIAAFALACVDAYRSQRAALIREARGLRVEVMREQGATGALERALIASLRSELDAVARTGDASMARAVSHRLWEAENQAIPEPDLHWSNVLRMSIARNPFATAPVVLIWSLSAVGTLSAAIGPWRALAQIAWSATAIAVAFSLGRRLVKRYRKHSVAILVVVLVAVVLVTGPVASLLFDPRPWPAGLGLVIVNALWLPVLTIGTGVVWAALRSADEVLASLRAGVSDEELALLASSDEAERLRRELATKLHGSVQSRLLAGALQGDTAGAALALESLLVDATALEATLTERLEAVCRPWSSLMAVSLRCDGAIAMREEVVRVVEEGLTNAYRHGHATSVQVSVTLTSEGVQVVVRDDGDGPPAGSEPGVGTAILNASASGGWSLSRSGDATVLTAHVLAARLGS